MKRFLLVFAVLIAATSTASAQDSQAFAKIYLGPCTLSTGSGAPSSGNVCDAYIDTSTGDVYEHKSSGNWIKLIDSWTAHNLLIGEGAGVAPNALAGCTNAVPWWASSSVDPTCQTSPTLTGLSVTSGNVQTTNYASQTTGWGITAAGAADFRYLFANELRILLFTAEQEAVLAGAQRVSKSYSTISQTFTCPSLGSTSTLWVNDSPTFANAAVFVSGDSVFIHALSRTALGGFSVSDCVGTVTSYADGTGGNDGQQSWTFTRYSGSNGGSMTATTTVAVNQLVQDLGVSGNGYVETIADDGSNNVNAPYTQIVTWASAPTAANLTVRCRLGQLTGITSSSEYGLLCGNYGGNAYVRFTDQHAEIKGIPLTLLTGSTPTIKLDPTGPDVALGNPVPTSAASGTGIWMDGNGVFRAGNPAADFIEWDTSHLTLVSSVLSIGSTGIQISVPGSAFSDTYAYKFSTAFSGTNHDGLYGTESGPDRILRVYNGTTAGSDLTEVSLATTSYELHLDENNTGSGGSGLFLTAPVFRPTANDSTDLGASGAIWHDFFADEMILTNPSDPGMVINMTSASSSVTAELFQKGGTTVGSIVVNASTTTYFTTSDKTLKTNIKPTHYGLGDLRKIAVDDYTFLPTIDPAATPHTGMLAQDLAAIYPEATGTTKDGVWQIDYGRLTPLIIQSIQDLDAAVTALTARVAALEAKGKQ